MVALRWKQIENAKGFAVSNHSLRLNSVRNLGPFARGGQIRRNWFFLVVPAKLLQVIQKNAKVLF